MNDYITKVEYKLVDDIRELRVAPVGGGQREFRASHPIFKKEYDPNLVNITVTVWPGGKAVTDGQHCRERAIRAEHYGPHWVKHIYLSSSEGAARVFLGENTQVAVRPIDKFLNRASAGDPAAIELLGIAERHGWSVKPGHFEAVVQLEKIYNGAGLKGARTANAALVDDTLATLVAAYGHDRDSVMKDPLIGVARVLSRYEGKVVRADLIKSLQKVTPVTLKALIAQQKTFYPTSDVAAEMAVVSLYDKGRTSKRKLRSEDDFS